MDPISVILALANFVALTDNLYRGVKFLRQTSKDPRADSFFIRLITEKAKYSEWRRRMDIEDDEGVEKEGGLKRLLPKLPDSAKDSILVILQPMGQYLEDTRALFQKYGIETPGQANPQRSLKNRLRRIDLAIDGARQINDLLDTISHCNEALLRIAPPPPGYFVSTTGNDQILDSEPLEWSLNGQQQQQHRVSTAGDQPDQPAPINDSPTNVIQGAPTQYERQHGSQNKKVFYPIIELLYSTCCDVLRKTAIQHPAEKCLLTPIIDRLSLWGSCLSLSNSEDTASGLSMDQVLYHPSRAIRLLRDNIVGALADLAITIDYTLSILGEPSDFLLALRLKEIFSLPNIAQLSLKDDFQGYDEGNDTEWKQDPLTYCSIELSSLVECLFSTLPTVEAVMLAAVAKRTPGIPIDDREMVLLKSGSAASLSETRSKPVTEMLKVDLELIAAMQESLKDTKFSKHLEHTRPNFDAKRYMDQLREESKQLRYWTTKLDTTANEGRHTQTQEAVMANLVWIAQTFQAYHQSSTGDSGYSPDELQATIDRCLSGFPDLKVPYPSISPNGGKDADDALDILKCSRKELSQLARTKNPEMRYKQDFTLVGNTNTSQKAGTGANSQGPDVLLYSEKKGKEAFT